MNDPADTPGARADGLRRWYIVGVLTLVYIFNFIDRQIISVLQEPMREELGLSDTQLGLLQGLTFALFYVTMGIPLEYTASGKARLPGGNRSEMIE